MRYLDWTLIILITAIVRVAVLVVAPTARHRRCQGTGHVISGNGRRSRSRKCSCKGGRVYRLGAVTVHRWRRSVRQELRVRREERS